MHSWQGAEAGETCEQGVSDSISRHRRVFSALLLSEYQHNDDKGLYLTH